MAVCRDGHSSGLGIESETPSAFVLHEDSALERGMALLGASSTVAERSRHLVTWWEVVGKGGLL